MDTPDLDRLTILEPAQQLYDATLRQHAAMQDPDEAQRQHEAWMRWAAAMDAAHAALHARLDRMLAQLEARDRLWRGEDGFDG